MGLAAPGYVEHRLSMHPCLVSQRQPGHIHRHQSSHIQTMSSDAFRCFLVPGIGKFEIDLIHDVARCTWPYHLSRRQRRTNVNPQCQVSVIVKLRVFRLELSLMPLIQQIMARSLQQSRCGSGLFGLHVSLPWSIAKRTQALYTLPRILLSEGCLVVSTGKSFLIFPLATRHLATMALSQPPLEHSISPR